MKAGKPLKKRISFKPRQTLFWDVDIKTLDPDRYPKYIIERILDFGNDNEVRWMSQHYSREFIKSVFEKSRVLHNKSKALWQMIYR